MAKEHFAPVARRWWKLSIVSVGASFVHVRGLGVNAGGTRTCRRFGWLWCVRHAKRFQLVGTSLVSDSRMRSLRALARPRESRILALLWPFARPALGCAKACGISAALDRKHRRRRWGAGNHSDEIESVEPWADGAASRWPRNARPSPGGVGVFFARAAPHSHLKATPSHASESSSDQRLFRHDHPLGAWLTSDSPKPGTMPSA